MELVILITWVALAGILSVYANRINRSPLVWFFLALLLSPLMMWLLLLALGHNTEVKEKRCERCKGLCDLEAFACMHCGHPFPARGTTTTAAA